MAIIILFGIKHLISNSYSWGAFLCCPKHSLDCSMLGQVVQLLLRDGWVVVDMKNRKGERAEIVAGAAALG